MCLYVNSYLEEFDMEHNCIVWYDEWQMACCGEPFSIGDKVKWPVSPDWNDDYLPVDMKQQVGRITYFYDAHADSLEGLFTLIGIVKNIQGVYLHFELKSPTTPYLTPVYGFLIDIKDDYQKTIDIFEKKSVVKNVEFLLTAYLIEMEFLEIKPGFDFE